MTRDTQQFKKANRSLLIAALTAITILATMMTTPMAQAQTSRPTEKGPIPDLLSKKQVVLGIFAGRKTAEDGAVKGALPTDFVFYSLENGPFDLDTMATYMEGLAKGAGETKVRPLALRIPPIGDDEAGAREKIKMAIEKGVKTIVIPHMHSAEQAAIAVDAMGPGLYPGNENGDAITMLIVEDVEGIANLKEITETPGVSVVFAGPGDLNRAYNRDAEAVEEAIQKVLAACKAAGVPAGITAGSQDIAMRIEQGFSVFIVQQPDTLDVGKEAAGRK